MALGELTNKRTKKESQSWCCYSGVPTHKPRAHSNIGQSTYTCAATSLVIESKAMDLGKWICKINLAEMVNASRLTVVRNGIGTPWHSQKSSNYLRKQTCWHWSGQLLEDGALDKVCFQRWKKLSLSPSWLKVEVGTCSAAYIAAAYQEKRKKRKELWVAGWVVNHDRDHQSLPQRKCFNKQSQASEPSPPPLTCHPIRRAACTS